jgi:hypothetical protein
MMTQKKHAISTACITKAGRPSPVPDSIACPSQNLAAVQYVDKFKGMYLRIDG